MKCKRFRNEELRNEEWFQFYTEFKVLAEQHTPQALHIEALFATFTKLYADADEALETIRKSATTEQLTESDNIRDNLFRGFADAVKSARNHFDPAKKEASRQIQIILDQYGNIARKPYDQETASIYNFVQDINAKAADVDLLGLADWIAQLDAENKNFEALMRNRYGEAASKSALRMKEVRLEADRLYRDILDRLDALMLLNGEEAYAPFVRELSVRVERYSNLLAQRKGRSQKSNDAE